MMYVSGEPTLFRFLRLWPRISVAIGAGRCRTHRQGRPKRALPAPAPGFRRRSLRLRGHSGAARARARESWQRHERARSRTTLQFQMNWTSMAAPALEGSSYGAFVGFSVPVRRTCRSATGRFTQVVTHIGLCAITRGMRAVSSTASFLGLNGSDAAGTMINTTRVPRPVCPVSSLMHNKRLLHGYNTTR